MPRYRLRFQLQEFDLRPGDTLLGRSSECHVTIEDPLVSRVHARIRVQGDGATVEDLGSRNGLSVNGRPLRGEIALSDGDRIRVGTQELVFSAAASDPRRATRSTGFMCHCADCGRPYPAELAECPGCGSDRRVGEETLSGVGTDPSRNWTLELLAEVLERAVSLERWDDVERVLVRSKANLDDRASKRLPVDGTHLDRIGAAAARLAAVRGNTEWLRWALGLHRAIARLPSSGFTDEIEALPPPLRATLVSSMDGLLEACTESPPGAVSARLRRIAGA